VSFFSLFDTQADVMRQKVIQGDTAAITESFEKIATISCRLTTATLSERIVQMREADVSTHTILCDANADIKSKDQLWVTVGNTVDKYLVNTVDPILLFATVHHIRVQATKAQ
jgi:hypothetical protein